MTLPKLHACALMFALVASPALARADEKNEPNLSDADTKPIVVPFTLLSSGHFLVSVKLNDKGPYKLIFDTGAPTMLLNNRVARDSGIIHASTKKPLFAPFGSMGQFVIGTLQIGGVTAKQVTTAVMDHPTVAVFSRVYEKEHGPIDGIVGFPFFARYRTTVDYQAKTLTFVPNGYKPTDVMQAMTNSLIRASQQGGQPQIIGAAGLWGIRVEKSADDESAGVIVSEVHPQSAAEQAGLKVGDRILTIDSRWTDTVTDCFLAAGFVKPGTTVPVKVLRDGKETVLSVTPRKGY